MPAGDRTGPWGRGPRTGRGFGYCSGYDTPGYAAGRPGRDSFGRGRGYGRGMGFGRGRGYRGFFPDEPEIPERAPVQVSRDEEKRSLERTLEDLETEVIRVKQRLKEFSKD